MRLCSIIVLLVIVLTGCTTLHVNVDEPIRNARIGIAYEVHFEPSLCQTHTGLTIFNNFEKKYDLDVDLEESIRLAFARGIKAVGSVPVLIETSFQVWDDITISSWDGKPTLGDVSKSNISEIGVQKQLDYILISFNDPRQSLDNEDRCQGIHIRTGGNYGMPFFSGVSSAFVFDVRTGEYLGTARLKNSYHDVKSPENPKSLTADDLAYYVDVAEMYAEASIMEFIEKTW